MAVFEIVHLLAGLLGLATGIGLLGPWDGYDSELVAGMWVAAATVAGTGIIISLASVGTGASVGSGLLLAKVVLTVGLIGLLYVTVGFDTDVDPDENRLSLIGLTALWVSLFGLGIALVA